MWRISDFSFPIVNGPRSEAHELDPNIFVDFYGSPTYHADLRIVLNDRITPVGHDRVGLFIIRTFIKKKIETNNRQEFIRRLGKKKPR